MSPEHPSWSILPGDFTGLVERQWPGSTARLVSYFGASVELEVPMPHSLIWGELNDRGQVFTFDGDLRDVAALAVWLRTLVPPEHPLIFCDEAYTHDLPLRPETTPEDILRAFEI